jgi:hypothetical protein
MKYLQFPTDYFDQAHVLHAIRKDEAFGERVLMKLIIEVGKNFQMGDWRRVGFDFTLVPYGYEFNKKRLLQTCHCDSEIQAKKFLDLLEECQKVGILKFRNEEYALWIEIRQMNEWTDESNEKTTRALFGKGKLSEEEMKYIAHNRDILSGKSKEQIRVILDNENKSSNYIDNNIIDINSSSSQALSDKGSDDNITFDTQAYGQQVQDDCERNEREYQEIMKDIEKNKKTK